MDSEPSRLRYSERLKLRLLDTGLSITGDARSWLKEQNAGRPLTPADYASTSGVILKLDGDVWVNAPIHDHNPNFVDDVCTGLTLDVISNDQLIVRDGGRETTATFWLPPSYHGAIGPDGKPYNHYVFSHGDRVRLSPVQGCSMVCKFCNIPYEDRYATKPIDGMLEALKVALNDDIQPARHILISGGTPHLRHHSFLQETYRRVLDTYAADYDVDIMMVPVDGLLDVPDLRDRGLHSLSINIEVTNEERARDYMRQKLQHGLDHYLRYIANAAEVLGEGRVRSLLMVGLEAPEDTINGVRRILNAGGTPVLSPFRPDLATPLAHLRPPSASDLEEIWLAAVDVVEEVRGAWTPGALGPNCPPCTHNTVTLLGSRPGYGRFGEPTMV